MIRRLICADLVASGYAGFAAILLVSSAGLWVQGASPGALVPVVSLALVMAGLSLFIASRAPLGWLAKEAVIDVEEPRHDG
jgi:hypothetical protein